MNTRLVCTMIVLAACGVTVAQPTIVCDFQEINEKICDTALGSFNDKVVWYHDNPFEGNYKEALDAGCIDWVKLTIKASDICTDDEYVAICFYDADGNKQSLSGYLQDGENCYYLDPTWLDGTNKVSAKIDYTCSSRYDWSDDACIKWSKLCVASECPVVPAPAAIVLGSIGSFMVATLRTLKNKKK